jgi:hypothetical protein
VDINDPTTPKDLNWEEVMMAARCTHRLCKGFRDFVITTIGLALVYALLWVAYIAIHAFEKLAAALVTVESRWCGEILRAVMGAEQSGPLQARFLTRIKVFDSVAVNLRVLRPVRY